MFEKLFGKRQTSDNEDYQELFDVVQRLSSSIDVEQTPIIYQYCSLSTFLSLVRQKQLWFSDINTMNDFSEMHWGYDRFIDAANLVLDEVGQELVEKIDLIVSSGQTRNLPVVCCFSKDGDVLSQWRAYGDDGAGVSVGFDTRKLQRLNARLFEVDYSREEQVSHFSDYIRKIHKFHLVGSEKEQRELLIYTSSMLAMDMSCMKSPAFQEEKEVRMVRAISVNNDEHEVHFSDVGGGNDDKASAKPLDVEFRERDGGLIAYLQVPFHGLGNDVIKEVVLGPKTRNNGIEVEAALRRFGFTNFKVRNSVAAYR